jgi:hypothetical protein
LLVQALIGETDRALIERPVTSSATASQIRCLSRVMHRRVPWRGVPLPKRLEPRGLAGRLVLPSDRPTALMGFNTLRSFAPPKGDRSFLIGRAHVLFAFASSARFIFVGLISPLAETRMRATSRAANRDDVSGQLLGFDSRLRSVSGASFCSPRIDPALGFASCRVSGTRTCIRMGSTPSESSVSELPGDARSAVVAGLLYPLMGFQLAVVPLE